MKDSDYTHRVDLIVVLSAGVVFATTLSSTAAGGTLKGTSKTDVLKSFGEDDLLRGLGGNHPSSAWKGDSRKFATPSNAQATAKIAHMRDTQGFPKGHHARWKALEPAGQ